jgi:outer membrane protein assembly factor BamB
MKFAANKSLATITIALILLSSLALAGNISVFAQDETSHGGAPTLAEWPTSPPAGVTPNATVETTAFISVTPSPIGLGQSVLVNLWAEPPTHYARYRSGYTVTITKPDGTTEVVGPMNSYQGDTTAWFQYVVDQVGEWKFKFESAGNYFPAGYYYNGRVYDSIQQIIEETGNPNFSMFSGPAYLESCYYLPATSKEQTITVQQDLVAAWPPAPLPTDYWTRPIYITNREWWVIGGQYPFSGIGGGPDWPADTNVYASNYKYTPYVQAPNSAHIVWRRQGAISGIAGGQYGIRSYGSGEGTYAGTPTIILQGRCYQSITKVVDGTPTSVWECYDLRTGEIYWDITGVSAPTVVTYNEAVPSVPGAEQTGLGSGSFSLLRIGSTLDKYDPWTGRQTSSVPAMSGTFYAEPFVLSVQNLGGGNYRLINWTTTGTDSNFTNRIMSNVLTSPATGTSLGTRIMGASLVTGDLLFNVTTDDITFSTSTAVADHGKYAVRMLGGWWDAWDLHTGSLAWKTPALDTSGGESYPWGDFGAYSTSSYGGMIFDQSYHGLYAISWDTGKVVWNFFDPAVPFETPWGTSPFFSRGIQIADGKLYIANGEHSPTEPLGRSWKLYCINVTTGEEIWSTMGGGSAGAVSDGYLTFDNVYDGYMYVYGKGQSAATITASQKTIALGESVLIEGTVLDESPAHAGTPCVSKDSMATQMEYLHMQQPIDGIWHNETITGVPVLLTAIASDGSVVDLGTVTTNGYYGTFSYAWTPPKESLYTVIAQFASDDSYGSSSAATAISVGPAIETPTPTPQEQPVDNTALLYGILIAVIIAIALSLVAIFYKR